MEAHRRNECTGCACTCETCRTLLGFLPAAINGGLKFWPAIPCDCVGIEDQMAIAFSISPSLNKGFRRRLKDSMVSTVHSNFRARAGLMKPDSPLRFFSDD